MSALEVVAAVAVGVVVLYLLDVRIYPQQKCRWCKGGKHWSPFTASSRPCWSCGGSGRRERWAFLRRSR